LNRKKKRMTPHKPPIQSRKYRYGLLIVHGVGNQKPGSTVGLLVARIMRTHQELGFTVHADAIALTHDSRPQTAHVLKLPGGDSALLAESYWADIIRRSRRTSPADSLKRVAFVMAVLPYLLVGMIFPRFHEAPLGLGPAAAKQSSAHSAVANQLRNIRDLSPTVWRYTSLLAGALVTWTAFIVTPPTARIIALGVIVLSGYLFLSSRLDVIEHVRITGRGNPIFESIASRVAADIENMSALCDEVWIIGHSQGGYISHHVLTAEPIDRWPNVRRFTGLASGLRPISLINSVRSRRWIISGWMSLIAAAAILTAVAFMYEPGGIMATPDAQMFGRVLLLSIAQPLLLMSNPQMLDAIFSYTFSIRWETVVGTATAALFIAGAIVVRRGAPSPAAITGLPARIRWQELASASDLVGSMSTPDLPSAARCRILPSFRQPVWDHLFRSHLSRTAVFRFEIVQWTARNGPAKLHLSALGSTTAELQHLAKRAHRLRLSVQIMFICLTILVPVAVFGRPLYESAQSSAAVGIVLAVMGIALTALWWTVSARKVISRLIDGVETGRAPRVGQTRRRRKGSSACVLVSSGIAIFGGLALYEYAPLGAYASTNAGTPVPVGLYAASGVSLVTAGLFALFALCLIIAEVHGVRAALAISTICVARSGLLLLSTGATWTILCWPGLAVMSLSMIAFIAAIRRSARLQTALP
jgi:hypothetical protein